MLRNRVQKQTQFNPYKIHYPSSTDKELLPSCSLHFDAFCRDGIWHLGLQAGFGFIMFYYVLLCFIYMSINPEQTDHTIPKPYQTISITCNYHMQVEPPARLLQ